MLDRKLREVRAEIRHAQKLGIWANAYRWQGWEEALLWMLARR